MHDIRCWKRDCSATEETLGTTHQGGFLLSELLFLGYELDVLSALDIVGLSEWSPYLHDYVSNGVFRRRVMSTLMGESKLC